MDPAVASVIASGIVAVAALLAPIFSNLWGDSLKWKREEKAKTKDNINVAAVELLQALAPFRSGYVEEATGRPTREIYSTLLSKYYAWETIVSSHCQDSNRERIRQLRAKLEGMQNLLNLVPEFADEILALTSEASEQVE